MSHLSTYTRLALFYSYIIHCISFVYSSLRRPLFLRMRLGDLYLTKDFDNGLGSELRRAGDLETPTVYFDISAIIIQSLSAIIDS